ncbi:patatin-like phospholipase family protein, partial [Propionibacterium freudenreichii]|nr:patatin-like phospholipase family protein [Propionibacterium freudenreichii]
FQLAAGLPQLGRASADLTAAWRGLERNRSLFKPGPILRRLLSRDFFHSEQVTSSGMTLRCAFVGLNSGELRYMREDGHIVDRDDKVLAGNPFDISIGVLASCSIPGVFKPVEMNGEWYVDGGIRENVPVEEAVSNLGVTRPYVIVSGPSGLNYDAQVGSGDLISILFRIQSIQSDESERDEVAYARSSGAVVIEPELSVHETMEFDPGTLRINRDYGWMRAAEAVHEADAATQQVNREIIETRLQAWKRERQMKPGSPHEFDQAMLNEVGQLKLHLQSLLGSADKNLLPPDAQQWWTRSEGDDAPAAS